MSSPSQGLRAVASMLETVTAELAPETGALVQAAASSLHQAADAEATSEAQTLGGPVAGPLLSSFATAMVDGFFALFRIKTAAPTASAG